MKKVLFMILLALSAVPGVPSAAALASGLAFALLFGGAYPVFTKKASKLLLQAAVVGIGFGMDFNSAIEAGKDGMLMTILSVVFVMVAGCALGRLIGVDKKVSYLVASGTAICGGSAIAAVAPVVKAEDSQISVSLGTVFTLNAIALFIFPPLGHYFGLNEIQFGEWAAIAIHDTSSVVGAGAAYGDTALQTATLVKCTRALWILPLAFATTFIMREKGSKVTVPWFILFFVVAMLVNTFMPQCEIWKCTSKVLVAVAKQAMCVTLFLVGSTLSVPALRKVGVRPLVQGVVLWLVTGAASLAAVMN